MKNRSRWIESIHLLLCVGMVVAAAIAWPLAPDRIPVHWNLQGEVDRYGGRFEGILLLPLVTLGLYVMLLLLPRLDPGRANYASFRSVYAMIRLSLSAIMGWIYALMLMAAFGRPIDMSFVLPLAVGLLFIVLGNVMGKLRPTWFVGVRTPWTLSSRVSWNRTHRLAGPLMIGFGLTIMAYAFNQSHWMLCLMIGIGLLAVLLPIVYSWLIWRSDEERIPPAGVTPVSE
ncbi:MAG: SdpI family protein [Verrucomicrobiota bacterium]